MNSRFSVIGRVCIVACAAFALLFLALNELGAAEQRVDLEEKSAQQGVDGPVIQATQRISIPFGFAPVLALMADGSVVVASGEGGCTGGQSITIGFTISQTTSSTSAIGLWSADCSGERQTWTKAATTTPGLNFTSGPAEACASAETRDSERNVTDTQQWCDDVILVSPAAYLPSFRSN